MIEKIFSFFLQPFASWYLSKDRFYRYKNLKLLVKKSVFHPGFFFSTKMLVNFLEEKDLKNKTLLELGAGSGLVSFVAAGRGANVTATDINSIAIEGLYFNAAQNQLPVTIIHSDLFDSLSETEFFDFVIINPPYYPRNPANDAEKAWFCGEDFAYFRKLFAQLSQRHDKTIWMILSEDCQTQAIQGLATQFGMSLKTIVSKKTGWEWNFIFQIEFIRV
jgi:release factor glutamine methyltransferase